MLRELHVDTRSDKSVVCPTTSSRHETYLSTLSSCEGGCGVYGRGSLC
jgi:hypothetical protein